MQFFWALIKYGEKDILYYDLIYTILTFQRQYPKSFPLGFCISSPEFDEHVLAKLPQRIREQVVQTSFVINTENEFDEYNLLAGTLSGYSANVRETNIGSGFV